ncbi:DUF6455 family protein [Celeribacter neptunius]|uniref:DUF6455 domain-containing protein n=1 Tax=Celeribacter neptunius TaxID=588602 RepID=A0A1I3VFZ5_9RHOB|nr:DUF6455 family protein [Celeribacter neptunius]SFJ94334.1 hypothetical protein SAMN04487991_3359 [Celeribacter neptunius]
MTKFGDYDTHADLVDRMSETLGLDLAEMVQRGEGPSEEESRRRVYRCLGCTDPEACVHFLDDHLGAGTKAEVAPAYCRNKLTLERLAAG